MCVCMYVFMYVCMSSVKWLVFSVFKPIWNVSTNFSTNRMYNSHSGGIALSLEDILLFACRSSALNVPKTRKGTGTPCYHADSFTSWTNVTYSYRQNTISRANNVLHKSFVPSNLGAQVTAGRFQWPRGLRRRSAAARLLGLRVRIPPGTWMFVSCKCCMLYRCSPLWWADLSSRSVLRSVYVSLSVITHYEYPSAPTLYMYKLSE